MTQPLAETLKPKLTESWTLVTRRRRRCAKVIPNHPSRSEAITLSSDARTPSPWIPTDSSPDCVRESKLLRRVKSSISRLESSRFFRRFVSRLRDPQIQGGLDKLIAGSSSQIQIVAYGIGSIESYESPRLQLALAFLLKQELGARASEPIQVFDPVLSAVECAVVAALGCKVIAFDECGRREAAAPTLFYMPHCEAALYDNLLHTNWKPEMLKRMVVLGNSFGLYEWNVDEMRSFSVALKPEVDWRHVLGVRRYVREVEMDERLNVRGYKEDDEDAEFYKAFHDTSWHFFELDDDDADMDILCR